MFHLLGNFLPPRKYYNRWWKALDTNQCQIQKIHVFTKRTKKERDEKHFSRHLKHNWAWLKEFPQNYHTHHKKKNIREKIEIEDLREKQYLQERNFEHWCCWLCHHHMKFWEKILLCPCGSWAKGGNVAKAMNWLWCYQSYLSLGPSHTWWQKQSWGRSGSLLMWKVIVIV